MSSFYHCIFCLKPTTSTSTPSQLDSRVVSTRRALTLLERHLRLEPSPSPPPEPSSNNQDSYYNACRSCASSLEAFCGLYETLKGLELKLEWEVAKLRSAVEHANRVPTRGAWVKQCYYHQQHQQGGEGTPPHSSNKMKMDKMYTWRRSFSKRCLTRLTSTFPKVLVSKLDPEPTTLALRLIRGEGESNKGHVMTMNHECDDDGVDVDDDLSVYSPSTSTAGSSTSASPVPTLLPNPPKVLTTPIKLFSPLLPPPPKSGMGFGNTASSAAAAGGHGHHDRIKLKGSEIDNNNIEVVEEMVKNGKGEEDLEDRVRAAAGEQKSSTAAVVGTTTTPPKVWRRTWNKKRSRGPSFKTCPVCNAGFSKSSNFKRHMSRAHDLEAAGITDQSDAFQCSQCPAWFATSRSLEVHMYNLHKMSALEWRGSVVSGVGRRDKKDKWTCAKCGDGKDWKCKTKLENHLRRCNDGRGRRNWCSQCDMKFKDWMEKNTHIAAVHGGLKCDQPRCQFITKLPLALERHRGGDKCPFPAVWICTSCGDGRNWENRRNFERHVKRCGGGGGGGGLSATGAGRRPRPSTVTAAFRRGKRSYYCAVCSKLFFCGSARTNHFRVNHDVSGLRRRDVKRCERPGCSAYFRTAAQLNNHENEFHDDGGAGGARTRNTSQQHNKSQGLKKKVHQLALVDPLDDDMEAGDGDHHDQHPIGDGCETNNVVQDVDDEMSDVKFVLPH